MDYEEKKLNEEEYEDQADIVELETEDGETISLEVDRFFFYNGDEYVLLVDPEEKEDEDGNLGCFIMKVVPAEDGEEDEEEFLPIEDEELLEKLLEIANTQYREDMEIDE